MNILSGILVVVALGVALGVAIGVILLVGVLAYMRRYVSYDYRLKLKYASYIYFVYARGGTFHNLYPI